MQQGPSIYCPQNLCILVPCYAKRMTAMGRMKMTDKLYLPADPSKLLIQVMEKMTLGENVQKY